MTYIINRDNLLYMKRMDRCPPGMRVFNFNIDNDRLLGAILLAKGCNPHPTVVLLHGFPGYEKNFDIAHILRRGGYNVLIFHYRGAWGSGGNFSFTHVIEDTLFAYNLFEREDIYKTYNIDKHNIFLVGHSMGGFAALMAGVLFPHIKNIVSISGVNFGHMIKLFYKNGNTDEISAFIQAQTIDPLSGTDIGTLTAELIENREKWDLLNHVKNLSNRSLLLLGARYDEDVPIEDHHIPLVNAFRKEGGSDIRDMVMDTDHLYSDMRLELSEILLGWLNAHIY